MESGHSQLGTFINSAVGNVPYLSKRNTKQYTLNGMPLLIPDLIRRRMQDSTMRSLCALQNITDLTSRRVHKRV